MSSHSIIKHSIIYFFAGATNKAIPFFLLPILTRYLSPAEYGLLAIYQIFLAFAAGIIGMGMPVNITRVFHDHDQNHLAELIGNLLAILVVASALASLGLLIVDRFFDTTFGIPVRWLHVVPMITLMNTVNILDLTVLRNQFRSLTFGFFEITKTIINLSITISLVVIFGFSWSGAVWGIIGAAVVFGLIGYYHLHRNNFIRWNIKRNRITDELRISLPIIPHNLGALVILMSDRLFIQKMIGTDEVGIYSVGYTFGLIITLFVEAFNKSWSPWMFQQFAKIDEIIKAKIIKYTYIYFVCMLLLVVLVTAISSVLIEYMTTPQYHRGQRYIFWITLGYAINGMYTLVVVYLFYTAKTQFLATITLTTAALNLIGNYILIASNGALGAAQATVLAFTFRFLAVWWFANRIYPMPWINGLRKS